MIIKKSVLAKLHSINCSDMELFTDTIKRFNPHKCCCPICGAKRQCKRIGSYPRMMITIKEGKRCFSVIRITRVRCLSCQHTHAILPDILVPFGSYTITFILSVLKAYLLHESTVAEICAHYQIAVSTLYSWIHLFTSRYNSWVPILQRIREISSHAIDHVMSVEAFPSVFFKRGTPRNIGKATLITGVTPRFTSISCSAPPFSGAIEKLLLLLVFFMYISQIHPCHTLHACFIMKT